MEANSSQQRNILQTCREMEGLYDAASKHHKDASARRMKKGENDVNKAMHTILRSGQIISNKGTRLNRVLTLHRQ